MKLLTLFITLLLITLPVIIVAQYLGEEDGLNDKGSEVILNNYSELKIGPLFSESGISVNYNYMIQKSNILGFGAGFDWTRYSFSNPYSIISVFGKYKGYLSSNNFAPFVTSSFGYGIPVSSIEFGQLTSSGGLFGDVGVGARVGTKEPLLEFGLSLRVQKANFEYTRDGVFILEDILFKRLAVSLGFLF